MSSEPAMLIARATAFLDGQVSPIEAAIELHGLAADFQAIGELETALLALTAVSSDTDHIALGSVREQWHPSVRKAEDRKHDQAQAWARPIVENACRVIIAKLA